MPAEGDGASQKPSYWVAVTVDGYDEELQLGLMRPVAWDTDISKVKGAVLDAPNDSLVLYPKLWTRRPDPDERLHVPKGLDDELDRRVEMQRGKGHDSPADLGAESFGERPGVLRDASSPQPRPGVDEEELAEMKRKVDKGRKL